jgi:hypothetical protein
LARLVASAPHGKQLARENRSTRSHETSKPMTLHRRSRALSEDVYSRRVRDELPPRPVRGARVRGDVRSARALPRRCVLASRESAALVFCLPPRPIKEKDHPGTTSSAGHSRVACRSASRIRPARGATHRSPPARSSSRHHGESKLARTVTCWWAAHSPSSATTWDTRVKARASRHAVRAAFRAAFATNDREP